MKTLGRRANGPGKFSHSELRVGATIGLRR